MMQLIATLPTTNLRIAISLMLFFATGVRVLVTNEAPPWEWLLFLGAAMGVDVVQFGVKRATQHNGQSTPAPLP